MTSKSSSLLRITRAHLDIVLDTIILLLVPVFFCFVVPDWIFTQIGYIDPFVYLGYFRNFIHHVAIFGSTYYASRLPFIIPGYICYKIFPPLAANYVLHLGFYYLSLFSLYFILRTTVNRWAALLSTIFMGFYPYFLAATGWDYLDGAGISYFLVTVLLLTLAAKGKYVIQPPNPEQSSSPILSRKHNLLLFLAGMSLAAMVYTTIFLLIVIPALVFYYFVMCPQSGHLVLKSTIVAGLGVISATMLFCIISVISGGDFLFFAPHIFMAGSLLTNPNPWLIPGYSWLIQRNYVVFPIFICLTSLLFVIVSLIHIKSGLFKPDAILNIARDNMFSLCHLLNFLLMAIVQLLGKPSFQIQCYATYLIPTAFLAAGAQLAGPLSRLSKSQYAGISVITISLLAGSYLVYYHTPLHSAMSSFNSIWYLPSALAVGASFLSVAGSRKQTVNTILIGLAFMIFSFIPVMLIATNNNQVLQISYCGCEQRQQYFQVILKSDDIIRTYDINGNLRFWYSSTEPLGDLYVSIASTRLWGYRLINDKFPEIVEPDFPYHKNELATIQSGMDIVILSGDKDALFKANAALNGLGLKANLIGTEEITQGSISFTMIFINVEAL